MSEAKPLEMSEEEKAQLQRQIFSSGKKLHEISEELMTLIEAIINLTGGDLKLVVDDLNKISEMIDLLNLEESIVRKLFKDVGTDLDETISNPAETITRKDVIALFADRAGSKEGKALADFLRGDSPEIVWG